MSEINELNDNELEMIAGGVNTGCLTESERQEFRFLNNRAERAFHDPDCPPIEFNNAVRNLTAFCVQMRGKYGDIFGYNG